MQHYLQSFLNDLDFESLPAEWQDFELIKFSHSKILHDFQREALKNIIKALYFFYEENKGSKEDFLDIYRNNGLSDDAIDDLNHEPRIEIIRYFEEYNYPIEEGKISFQHFINRASFWMATGSGKTLVIIKIIEFLKKMMEVQRMPDKDILFLAHREDLLQQFRNHIDEFNSGSSKIKIKLKSLKDYAEVKNEYSNLFHEEEITIFYYRSDLISNERKESLIDFRSYDNNGNWYILLDEAHKGDRQDSKRQSFYNILSRNGFLFNFSATFTDDSDYITCAFNFNLEKFVQGGYGKHIYVSENDVIEFINDDFGKKEKQKIILKTIILQTYIRKNFEIIRKQDASLYHSPLLMTLVNSVNTEDADLKLFFSELVNIAKNAISQSLFDEAKSDLLKEFNEGKRYNYEDEIFKIDQSIFSSINYNDILRFFFNTESFGNIEILKIPGNTQELILKLKTTESPFALIKIGDVSDWFRALSKNYEIIEKFENRSMFEAINRDDSQINILMGSRAFYEGWDSNRPNIVLFINIGVGNAQKFILQSIGRGVRIEPLKHERKRLLQLYNSGKIDKDLFNSIEAYCQPIETLFIYGTHAENLNVIMNTMGARKKSVNLDKEFSINEMAKDKTLLIPVYDKSVSLSGDVEFKKCSIEKSDFESIKKLFNAIGDKISLVKYGVHPRLIKKFEDSLQNPNDYYNFNNIQPIGKPEFLLGRMLNYFDIEMQKLDGFKNLEEEIIHFKHVRFTGEDIEALEELRRKIAIMQKYPKEEKKLENIFSDGKREEYDKMSMELQQASFFELNNQKVKIKYIAEHYYLPIIVSDEDKIDYLNYIIDVGSEKRFINDLEAYIKEEDNFFSQFDWWMFSKIDHRLDKIYTPYYNSMSNKISPFFPDFIFWMQKGKDYMILFIDPKGTEHTSSERKIDGFWETLDKQSEYSHSELNIKVKLLFRTNNMNQTTARYRKDWFDDFTTLPQKLLS